MEPADRTARRELSRGWAGQILLDELHLAEARAVVRAYLVTEQSSRAELARELGLSPGRFNAFLCGVDVKNGEWDRIRKWCAGKPTPPVAPETVALSVLTRWAPKSHRHKVRAALAESVREAYTGIRRGIPPNTLVALDVV